MPDEPDFATLYGASPLTPRMAARLWVAFRQGRPEMWLEQLPTVAGTHVDERLIAAFGSRFDVIALRLAEGLNELSAVATCTADELALHLIIEYAADLYGDARARLGVDRWASRSIA